MSERLPYLSAALTVFMYDGEQIAILEGAVSVPIGARVEVRHVDYIVNNVRVGTRATSFDLYYECHMAEETGTAPPIF